MRVAFAGPRGVGKTTLALHLERQYECQAVSLASPIKVICTTSPPASHAHEFLWAWAERIFPKRLGIQARFVARTRAVLAWERDPGRRAQQIGSVGRELDERVWIDYLFAGLPDDIDVVLDDVRFENEARALRQAGFVLIRLRASEQALADRLARRGNEHRDPSHPSEHGLNGLPDEWWDAVWQTDEALEVTLSRLDAMVERLSRRAG